MAAAASSSVVFASSREQECQQQQPVITHLIVLVHGWMGNAAEMDYIKQSLERESLKHPLQKFVVVSPKINEGKTHDGIAAGGERLAQEVSELIQQHQNEDTVTTLSFIGNSLGGLYGRFALSKLDLNKVAPLIFCTTATPHLGVSRHTYIPLPKWGEYAVAQILRPTGRDLFNVSPIIEEMAFQDIYTEPLQRFQQRIAYANAFGTDFQVPTCTAAFLCPNSPHTHVTVNDASSEHFVLTVETRQEENPNATASTSSQPSSMGHALDQMGWKKVFCDVRDKIPMPSIPRFFAHSTEIPKQHNFSTQELIPVVTAGGSRVHVPLGHQVLVANSKNEGYAELSAGGRPIVDQMAADMIADIVKHTEKLQQEEQQYEYEA